MAVYKHKTNTYHKKTRAVKVRKISILVSLVIVIGGLVVAADWARGQFSNTGSYVTKQTTSSVQSVNVTSHRTDYFQFQTTDDWLFATNQSTDTKFVYFKKDDPLITERFVVYVNRPAIDDRGDISFNRVMPVKITPKNTFQPGEISAHCSEFENAQSVKANARVKFEDTSFVCSRGSQEYNIVLSEIGGNESIGFEGKNGPFNLTMVYSNLTAYPNTGDLPRLISTFQILE